MSDDNMNDHDRLIAMEQDIKSILENQARDRVELSKFASRIAVQYTALESRVRDSEKSTTACDIKTANMKEDIRDLKRKSNIWDGLNSIAAVTSAIIGVFVGGNKP